ncbi:MAG TPA: gluconate 2-dehydrogenase subunit 3 family protein [Terriglobales bacterium]|nr:gluconate 2-dehydrogenase subunit 3 family protein [Terriglobales bacterium]
MLTTEQLDLLAAALDEVIPPNPSLGLAGAGSLGMAEHIAGVLARTPELVAVVSSGLDALSAAARQRGAAHFGALPADLRRQLVGEQGFLFLLMFIGYAGYYQHPLVLTALGLEARPPHPQGHSLPPNDASLLDPVRQRGRMYRET